MSDEHVSLSAWPGDGRGVVLRVPHRGNWILGCRGEGYWCPRLEVGAYDAGGELTLPLFRAAKAVGRLQAPRGVTVPQTLVLQGRANLDGKGVEVVETVTVSQGRFSLDLPRDTMDLRSTAPGWTPHYWWSLDCRRNRVDLGTIDLRRGSSVSGFVDSQSGRPARGVQATLEFKADLDPGQQARLKAASLHTVSDKKGFFQIAGVEPGRYQLELRRGEEPETFVDTVEVLPDTELYLGRILRRKPVSVTFEVRPPRDPRDAPWGIVVRALAERVSLASDERLLKVDRQGRAEIKRLNPDAYEILVIDSNESRFLRTEVELQADTQLTLDVPLVEVEGTVRIGTIPLSASVALHDTQGDQADFISDVQGRFTGWMRRPNGSVLARIQATHPPVERRVWLNDVREDEGKLHVGIHLEDFAIAGRVVDEEGRPLSARVHAEGLQERSSATADDEGRFFLDGLAGGRYLVVARRPDRPEMRPQEVELNGDTPSREILLVMNQGRVLHGRVLSAEGQPVPGAAVQLDVLGQASAEREAPTELDGSFRVIVPEEAALAHVTVLSGALPWFAKCVSLPRGEEELTIHLAPLPPARVQLLVPNETPRDAADGGRWRLFDQDGGVFDVGRLSNWEFQQTGRSLSNDPPPNDTVRPLAILTGLPAGSYALIRSFSPTSVLVTQACTEGPPAGAAWSPVAGGDTTTISYAATPAGGR